MRANAPCRHHWIEAIQSYDREWFAECKECHQEFDVVWVGTRYEDERNDWEGIVDGLEMIMSYASANSGREEELD